MENIYYSLNKNFEFSIEKDGLFATDNRHGKQFSFHGKGTSEILIPIIDQLNKFITIDEIEEITGKSKNDVVEVLEQLLERDVIIEYGRKILANTINLPSLIGSLDKNIEVVIVADFYMSQLSYFEESFLNNSNIKFTYIFVEMEDVFFQDIVVSQLKNKSNRIIKEESNLEEILRDTSSAVIVSLVYGSMEKYKSNYINRRLDRYAAKKNVPVLYANLNSENCVAGPLYFPRKTASFEDLVISNEKFPTLKDDNFLINQIVVVNLVAMIVNDLNWILFKNVSPLLIDCVRVCSGQLNHKYIHIYRY